VKGVAFIWRLAVHTDRRRLATAVVLLGIGYLSTPFIGVLLKSLTDSALAGQTGAAVRYALSTAVLLVFELMMGHFAHLYYFELGEKRSLQPANAEYSSNDVATRKCLKRTRLLPVSGD